MEGIGCLCGRKSCPRCHARWARRRFARLWPRLRVFPPAWINHIVLTLPGRYQHPWELYNWLKNLVRELRRRHLEWLWVVHRYQLTHRPGAGWSAHLHLLVVTPAGIDVEALQRDWHALTGAFEVGADPCRTRADVKRRLNYLLRPDDIRGSDPIRRLYEAHLQGLRRVWTAGASRRQLQPS